MGENTYFLYAGGSEQKGIRMAKKTRGRRLTASLLLCLMLMLPVPSGSRLVMAEQAAQARQPSSEQTQQNAQKLSSEPAWQASLSEEEADAAGTGEETDVGLKVGIGEETDISEDDSQPEEDGEKKTGLLDPATAVEEDYVENEWNFVDGSMDISGGIPVNAPGRLEKIRAAGKLVVATEPYFAPQEFIDPFKKGQESFVGADMEFARLIAERMGVELEIVPLDFTQVLSATASGEYDLAISALAYTPARAASMELSKAYHYDEQGSGAGLLIRRGEAIFSVNDLAERDIAAQRGSLQETLMAENVKAYRQFKRLTGMQDIFDQLEDGRIDAAAVDPGNAGVYIRNNPDCNLTLVDRVYFSVEPQYDGDRVAAPKGEIALIYFVNSVIDEMVAQDSYDAWYTEYAEYAAQIGLE